MPGLKHTGKWGSDRSLLNCSPSHLGRQRPLIWGTWGQKGTANELHAARCPPPAPARPFPLGFQKLGLEASQGSFINLNPKGAFANLCLSRDGISVGLRFDSNGNRTKASPMELPSGSALCQVLRTHHFLQPSPVYNVGRPRFTDRETAAQRG